MKEETTLTNSNKPINGKRQRGNIPPSICNTYSKNDNAKATLHGRKFGRSINKTTRINITLKQKF